MPRVRGGVGFGEECGLSEVTEIEGFSVLENIEIIMILMSENDRISNMNNRVFPFRNSINYHCCGMTELEE